MASPLYGLAAINAIVFGVQGNVQRRLSNPDSITSHCIAGSIAGFAQCIICSPMELAKTRMQIQGQGESRRYYRSHVHSYTGPVDCLHKIYKAEGYRGVFRGFLLTVIRETPSFGIYFGSFELMVRQFQPSDPDELVGTLPLLVCGGLAGMCAWLCTYPSDVIKSRIQADSSHAYNGFFDCVVKSYKAEGWGVFTRGLGSTMLRAFPVNAATFTTVAMVLRYMKAGEEDDGAYDYSYYAQIHPHANLHMSIVPNFPSQMP
jgi:solute carrier family 25 carnitine/acylcarnitine transporter 20/29